MQFDSRNGASNDIALEASFAPDGSVVVGGLTWYSAERTTALLARFTATGAVDDTYGYHGVAGVTGSDARAIEAVTALSPIATDGSVTVAVEHTRNASGDGPDAPVQPFVRRFSAAGTRVAFGRNPLGAALPIGSLATTIASTGDGAVLLGGSAPIAGEEANALVGAVMRLTPGGRLDGTFDRAGIAIPVDGGTGLRQGIVTGLAVQADGSILAAGAWNGVARIARLFGSSAGGAGQARPVVTERVLRGAPRAGCGARARSACLATGIVTVQVQVRGVAATEAVVRVGPASGPISVDRRITVHLDAHGRGTARIHVADDQESDTFGVHAWIAATASSQSAVSPTLFLVRPPTADDTAPVGATRPAPPNRVAAACALARRSSGVAALDARFACAAARR